MAIYDPRPALPPPPPANHGRRRPREQARRRDPAPVYTEEPTLAERLAQPPGENRLPMRRSPNFRVPPPPYVPDERQRDRSRPSEVPLESLDKERGFFDTDWGPDEPAAESEGGGGGGSDWGDGGGWDGGGGSGGGGGEPAPEPEPLPIAWREAYTVEGAPAWWRGFVPDRLDPIAEYAVLLNSSIPFMSPEDQRTAADNLARLLPGTPFAAYNPDLAGIGASNTQVTTEVRNRFSSRDRAAQVLVTLQKVRDAMGTTADSFGPGYRYLQSVAGVLRDYGGAPAQTQQQYLGQLAALDPLIAESKGETLQAYATPARMLAQPFFTGGPLRNASRDEFGNWHFGRPNPQLFG